MKILLLGLMLTLSITTFADSVEIDVQRLQQLYQLEQIGHGLSRDSGRLDSDYITVEEFSINKLSSCMYNRARLEIQNGKKRRGMCLVEWTFARRVRISKSELKEITDNSYERAQSSLGISRPGNMPSSEDQLLEQMEELLGTDHLLEM